VKPRTSHGQHTLPREYFESAAIWQLEQARIFRSSWLLAGHVSELAENGSYCIHETGNDSVMVVRDSASKIHAHHNFCRHRGTRLCAAGRGRLDRPLQCSYHAWTYALDGTLKSAPNMQGVAGFDKADWGLKPAALAEWCGFLFVNVADHPQPFASALPALTGKFAHWPLSELRSIHQTVYEATANWKLIFHNYSECYHCPAVHPHLNRLTPYRNTENDLQDGPVLGGPMGMSNPDGSMSVHGGRCAPPFAGLTAEERGRVYYYTLFPSAFVSLHPDYVLVHRVHPLARDRTRIVCDWYFHPQAISAAGFDPQPAVAFWDLTNRQDWTLCENAFRGVRSPAWEPGPYSELESQLAAFDRHYLRMLDPAREVRLQQV
jgi:glycine betaine catabolism A